MPNDTPFLDGAGTFNALTENAGTIKYGTFNNAATNTGAVAVSAVFGGTAINHGIIGNILPINSATVLASNSAAWDSTYATVEALSATWSAGGGGGGAVDLGDVPTASASWDAAYAYVNSASANLVLTNDARLTNDRNPTAHTHVISSVTGLQAALDAKQASGSYITANDARLSLVGSNSGSWDSVYASVAAASATWSASGSEGAAQAGAVFSTVNANSATWSTVTTKANASHTHVISDVTGLQTTINSLSGSYAAISHTHTASQITDFNSSVDARITTAAGTSIATLSGGKIPASQLPSYVDDVLEYNATNDFPATGSTGIIYVATSTNKVYRWSGSAYVEISPSPGSTDSVTEGSSNLYFTNARAVNALQATVGSLSSAIDGKQSSGSYAASSHTHAIADVTGLQSTLNTLSSSTISSDAKLTLIGSNSGKWDSVYASVAASSGTWGSGGAGGGSSVQGDSAYSTVNANSATWSTVTTKANASHTHVVSDVTGLQTTINNLSTAIDGKQVSGSYAATSHIHTASQITDFNSSVDARLSTIVATSANWNSDYTTVNSNSASWGNSYTTTNNNSANWGSSYTTLNSNSASWASDRTTVNSNSASWSSVYTSTVSNSSTWNTVTSKANSTHSHSISDVTNLQSTLDGKQAAGSYAAASHTHTASQITDFNTAADARITAAAGVTVASLVGGVVPAAQLPSYVDDVLEYAATGNFPVSGSTGIIYVATGTNKVYRWSGSAYIEISPSPGSTDSVTEGSTNLYFTNARAISATSSSYAATSHTHTASQITDFNSSVDARLTTINSNSASWGSVYTTTNSNSSTWNTVTSKANATHTHAIADVTNLQTSLDGKAATSHTHAIADVTNLQTSLDAKAKIAPSSTKITGDGSTTTFAINGYTTTDATRYLVFLDGIHQTPTDDYTISSTSGGSITFIPAPANGVKGIIRAL